MPPEDNLQKDEMSVADLMAKRPELVPTFVAAGMICVGCAMAIFCDLLYVQDIYGSNIGELLSTEGMAKKKHPQAGNSAGKGRKGKSMLTSLFVEKQPRNRRKGDDPK